MPLSQLSLSPTRNKPGSRNNSFLVLLPVPPPCPLAFYSRNNISGMWIRVNLQSPPGLKIANPSFRVTKQDDHDRTGQEAPGQIPDLCTCGHPDVTAPPQTGCSGHQAAGRGQETGTSEGQQEASPSPEQLTYREWETKSYTGIWTVFPSVISLSVLKMSSLSKASEGNQTVKMLANCKMISPVMTNRHPSKPVFYPHMYHILDKHPSPPKSLISTPSRMQTLHFKPKCVSSENWKWILFFRLNVPSLACISYLSLNPAYDR